jgi:hypothetical protein
MVLAMALAVSAGCGSSRSPDQVAAFDPDSIPEAFARPSGALMWPGATRAVLVDSVGNLWNGAWLARAGGAVDGVVLPPPRTVAYEERWCPVVRWKRTAENVTWEFEAVALPAPTLGQAPIGARRLARAMNPKERRREQAIYAGWAPDRVDSLTLGSPRRLERIAEESVGLLVSMEMRITNHGMTPRQILLNVAFEPPGQRPPFMAADFPVSGSVAREWAPGAASDVIGWADFPHRGGEALDSKRLSPGETLVRRAVLSAYPISQVELSRWAQVPHRRRVDETRSFWRGQMNRGTRFELGDREVEDAIRAARVVLLACSERRGSRLVPLGNPFQYRDVWIRDGARAVQALAVHGYTVEARAMALAFQELQWPNGAFASQRGQLDATGQALWAYEQTMLRPSPDRNVAALADDARLAWQWYERVRNRGTGGAEGPAGMMPAGDPNDNEMVRAPLVGNDAWAIAGYRAAARLLRAAGRLPEAEQVEQSLAAYRRAFAAAAESVPSPDLPPSWVPGGYDWGNLAAVYPCDAMPADSPRALSLARRYWEPGGGAGLGHYANAGIAHGYVGADLGTWALLAGRRASADSVLESLLTWRTASGGAAETFGRDTRDYGTNLPPHATAAAALLALTRNSLVFDDGDRLQLTLGARERWWEHGRVQRAPTRFGLIDLEFSQTGSVAEWRWTPVPVTTELTLPAGTALAEDPPAPLARGRRPDVIEAPPGTGQARVTLRGR